MDKIEADLWEKYLEMGYTGEMVRRLVHGSLYNSHPLDREDPFNCGRAYTAATCGVHAGTPDDPCFGAQGRGRVA